MYEELVTAIKRIQEHVKYVRKLLVAHSATQYISLSVRSSVCLFVRPFVRSSVTLFQQTNSQIKLINLFVCLWNNQTKPNQAQPEQIKQVRKLRWSVAFVILQNCE